MRWERISCLKFFECFEMRGHIRTLRLDLMSLCNRLFFHPYDKTGVALILLTLLDFRIAILFPSFLSTTRLVQLRLPLLSGILGILEKIQLGR